MVILVDEGETLCGKRTAGGAEYGINGKHCMAFTDMVQSFVVAPTLPLSHYYLHSLCNILSNGNLQDCWAIRCLPLRAGTRLRVPLQTGRVLNLGVLTVRHSSFSSLILQAGLMQAIRTHVSLLLQAVSCLCLSWPSHKNTNSEGKKGPSGMCRIQHHTHTPREGCSAPVCHCSIINHVSCTRWLPLGRIGGLGT